MPANQGKHSADTPGVRDAEAADTPGIEEGTDGDTEKHDANPGEEREVVTRIEHAVRENAKGQQPYRTGVNGFDKETRPDENRGRDDVPFAKPKKRDAEDHGQTHHLQEVEEHIVAVTDDEVDGKGSDDGNGYADKKDLNAPPDNCRMVFAF